MKEKLFLRATRSTGKKRGLYSIFLNLILLPLLCIPVFFSATALEKVIPQQQQQAVIYIGGNTIVYSNPAISNAVVVKLPNKIQPKKVEHPQTKCIAIERLEITIADKRSQELKSLQQEIDKKVKNTFYSTSHENDLSLSSKFRFVNAATITPLLFKFSKATLSINYGLNRFKIFTPAKKFYTTIISVEFREICPTFLRGPPRIG